ncbi:uncharacterized protein LOC111079722 [Drosophila obscura]|uniref:uncharacterized protein LOC111079722 n=1 Tax=Drosophila obscura TaxID=7282 RepID=UPI001BB299AE|nr:uncharacterized protein LOC111079722 [Drosophila obscura]
MIVCTSCCYYFDLRWGCIVSGALMIVYYPFVAYLLFAELAEVETELHESIDGSVETQGFWILGFTYSIMAVLSFVLLLAGLLNSSWLCLVYLLAHIPPFLVNSFYLFVSILYDIDLEMFIIYAVPQILVIYIDLVAYSFLDERRIITANRKYKKPQIKVIEY